MRIKSKTRSEKAARTRKRNANPLLAAKKLAERPQPAKPDWETLRPRILESCLWGCYLCGEPLTEKTMTVDHIRINKMGERKNDSLDNLAACCAQCNSLKGSRRITGEICPKCCQLYIVSGLGCLRCKRNKTRKSGVRTERTGRFTI